LSASREVSLAALAQCNVALIFWFFCIKTKEQKFTYGAENIIQKQNPKDKKSDEDYFVAQ
jgi:hypothetical protein